MKQIHTDIQPMAGKFDFIFIFYLSHMQINLITVQNGSFFRPACCTLFNQRKSIYLEEGRQVKKTVVLSTDYHAQNEGKLAEVTLNIHTVSNVFPLHFFSQSNILLHSPRHCMTGEKELKRAAADECVSGVVCAGGKSLYQ